MDSERIFTRVPTEGDRRADPFVLVRRGDQAAYLQYDRTLAVSPEIKCTDRGLLDVARKRFLPLIERMKGDS